MSAKLHIRSTDRPPMVVDLAGFALPCVLGRDSELSQIAVPDSQVSRAHCMVSLVDGQLVLEDLGSRNGTWLNNRKLGKGPLAHGDRVRIGGTDIDVDLQSSTATDPLVGQRLGGFELQGVLGKGRYGTVYRGVQVALGRSVAVKILAEEYRADPERVQAFLTEARRAGRLNHPNLVQVHDVCEVDENYLLIMELMTSSMADQLRIRGKLGEAQVLDMVCDVAKALGYAESQRLVHRDVKPDNILLNEEGAYKLADLGIAAAIAADGQAHQERTFGSPHYVAPEQARGGAIDGRADLYALGASAWHLLVGSPIYAGSSRQVIACHINSPLPDLQRLVPDLSDGFHDLICELLEKDPDDRPANAGLVVQQVQEIRNAPPATASSRLRTPRRRRRGRRRRS